MHGRWRKTDLVRTPRRAVARRFKLAAAFAGESTYQAPRTAPGEVQESSPARQAGPGSAVCFKACKGGALGADERSPASVAISLASGPVSEARRNSGLARPASPRRPDWPDRYASGARRCRVRSRLRRRSQLTTSIRHCSRDRGLACLPESRRITEREAKRSTSYAVRDDLRANGRRSECECRRGRTRNASGGSSRRARRASGSATDAEHTRAVAQL